MAGLISRYILLSAVTFSMTLLLHKRSDAHGVIKARNCDLVKDGESPSRTTNFYIPNRGGANVPGHAGTHHSISERIKQAWPFDQFTLGDKKLSDLVKCYDHSKDAYNNICENIEDLITEAINIRKAN